MENRKQVPPIIDAINFDVQLKPYHEWTLDNGVKVYAIDAGAEEVLQLEWVFYAGNSYETQNLVAASVNYLLKNGTSKKSAFEVNEHFEYYGAYLNRNCYNETASVTLHCLNRHIAQLLPVVEEILTDSIFSEAELQLHKQNSKQRLQVNLKKCDFIANRLADEYLYSFDHPYGRYSSAEAYDALDRSMLQAFYNQYYKHGHCILFVAGKLPLNLLSLLNQHFGKLPLNQQPLEVKQSPAQPATEKKYRVINDANGVQGAIRIARPFPNRHHPDFQRVMVLNSLFGGFFGSRLMSNIREDKGYTYGIHSYLQNHIQQSAWMISTEAGRDVCEATVQEVYKEMALLREEPADEEELLLVKNFMIGSILGDLDGPFQIIGRWKNLILNGLDGGYFYKSIDIIKNITAEELQELAGKYLREEEFYELVVV